MKSKRVLVIADLHTGHRAGLTPPQWQTKPDASVPQQAKWATLQREMWQWYNRTVAALAPIDLCIVNGDAIEGKGGRSEGVENIINDRNIQSEAGFQAISRVQAREYRMVRGTAYHGGQGEDFENNIAEKLECKIGDHEWYDINGLIFDCKHKATGATMPHTQATGLLGDALWNMVWAEHQDGQPRGNIFIRSHLHFSYDTQGLLPNQRLFITPALQGPATKYGARECRRLVQVGMLLFVIKNEREWTWKTILMDMKFAAPVVEKL